MDLQPRPETYQIKTSVFEGPFAVLLDLIEKRKLFINDVSLAQVTEDFLHYMNESGNVLPSQIASFVAVASTLLLIKSRSLLPNLELSQDEESDIRSLEERLRMYELFTRLSGGVKNNFGKKIIFFPDDPPAGRAGRRGGTVVFLPDERITRENMMMYVQGVLGAMPKKTFMPEVEVRKVISIEEMIDSLTDRIQKTLRMSFRDLHGQGGTKTKEEKVVVIVGFLAMLELVRTGLIEAMQSAHGEDIFMEKL